MKKEIKKLNALKTLEDEDLVIFWISVIAENNLLEDWVPKTIEVLKDLKYWKNTEKSTYDLIQEKLTEKSKKILEGYMEMIRAACDSQDLQAINTWVEILAATKPIEDWILRTIEILRDTNCLDIAGEKVIHCIKKTIGKIQDMPAERANHISSALDRINHIIPIKGDGFYIGNNFWDRYCFNRLWVIRHDRWHAIWDAEKRLDYNDSFFVKDRGLFVIKEIMMRSLIEEISPEIRARFFELYFEVISEIDVDIITYLFEEGMDNNVLLAQYIFDRQVLWSNEIYQYDRSDDKYSRRMHVLCSTIVQCTISSGNYGLFATAIEACLDGKHDDFNTDYVEDRGDLVMVLLLEYVIAQDDALHLIHFILGLISEQNNFNLCVTILLGAAIVQDKKDCVSYLLYYVNLIDHSVIFMLHKKEWLRRSLDNDFHYNYDGSEGASFLDTVNHLYEDGSVSGLIDNQKKRLRAAVLPKDKAICFHPIVQDAYSQVVLGFSKNKRNTLIKFCQLSGIKKGNLSELMRIILPILFTLQDENVSLVIRVMIFAEKIYKIEIDPENAHKVLNQFVTCRCSKKVLFEAVFSKAKFIRNWFAPKARLGMEVLENYIFTNEIIMSLEAIFLELKKITNMQGNSYFANEILGLILKAYLLGTKFKDKNEMLVYHVHCDQIVAFVCDKPGCSAFDKAKYLDFSVSESENKLEASYVKGP